MTSPLARIVRIPEEGPIALAQAKAVLGEQIPEELPELACQAMVEGLASPALIELAGMDPPTWGEAGPVFEQALRELGYAPISRADAALGSAANEALTEPFSTIQLQLTIRSEILGGEVGSGDVATDLAEVERDLREAVDRLLVS